MLEVLTTSLAEQEEIIERHVFSFREVGLALMRIRDDDLYLQAGFSGFVEYLESKPWGIGRAQAYNMIETSAISSTLEIEIPQRQARELAPLAKKATPEVVKQVYAEVVEETSGKPTATAIREKVQPLIKKKHVTKRADYNKKIDARVVPSLRVLCDVVLESEDWRNYSQATLKKRIELMERARENLGTWIEYAQAFIGSMPTK